MEYKVRVSTNVRLLFGCAAAAGARTMAPIVGIIQRVESAALSSNWPLIFEQDNCQQGQVIFLPNISELPSHV